MGAGLRPAHATDDGEVDALGVDPADPAVTAAVAAGAPSVSSGPGGTVRGGHGPSQRSTHMAPTRAEQVEPERRQIMDGTAAVFLEPAVGSDR